MDEEATLTGADDDQDAELVSALIGDDDDESTDDHADDGQEEDDGKPDRYKVKINGVEKHVSKDELIAHYQKGQASNEKFEEAAALRREAEQQKASITQHQEQLQQAINHFNAQAQRWASEGQPDWQDLLDNNPHEYLRQKEIWGKRTAEFQQAQAAQAHLDQQRELQQQEYLTNHLKAESAKLTELLPEWKDEALKDKEGKELVDYLTKQGYTREEMNNLNNSKASNIKLVINAMRYEKLMEKVNSAKAKKTGNVTDLKPVPTVSGASTARKSPEKMTDREFAAWRRSQIAKRN
ncbi:MAG: hypothetical protein ACXWAT_00030 [Methylobacter sp.]